MIEECNFKKLIEVDDELCCSISFMATKDNEEDAMNLQFHLKRCDGEDNCMLYQMYKMLYDERHPRKLTPEEAEECAKTMMREFERDLNHE